MMTREDSQTLVTILKGGRVVDPSRGIDKTMDIGFAGDRIIDVEALPRDADQSRLRSIGVSGCIVCPGLIDSHVHTYGGIGTVPPDTLGVGCGVTSVIDAGSAGSSTIDDLAVTVQDAKTTVHSIMYIQSEGIGAAGYRRNRSPREIGSVNVGDILDRSDAHRGIVRGVKGTAQGEFGPGWIEAVKTISRWAEQRAYFHLGSFKKDDIDASPTEGLFEVMDAGDIITHMYTGQFGHVLDEQGHVLQEALRAKQRGVRFDIGFGRTGFAFRIAERALSEGLLPDMLSSDIQLGIRGDEVKNLLDVASTLMCLGVSIEELIPMMTLNVVRAFGLDDQLATLQPGSVADISIFERESGRFEFADTERSVRRSDYRLRPHLVIKGGEIIHPDPDALSAANRNYRVLDHAPDDLSLVSPAAGGFLESVAKMLDSLHDWHPDALQLSIRRLAPEVGVSWKDGLTAINVALTGGRRGPQLGWWLESLHDRNFAVADRFREVAGLVK